MQQLDRYEEVVGHAEVQRLRNLAVAPGGTQDRPRQLHEGGRWRGRNSRLDDSADARTGARRLLGGDFGAARFLPRHQNAAQRPAGAAGLVQAAGFRSASRRRQAERRKAEPGGRRRHRARPAADLSAGIHAARTRSNAGFGGATSTRRGPTGSSGSTWPARFPATRPRSFRWRPSRGPSPARCS